MAIRKPLSEREKKALESMINNAPNLDWTVTLPRRGTRGNRWGMAELLRLSKRGLIKFSYTDRRNNAPVFVLTEAGAQAILETFGVSKDNIIENANKLRNIERYQDYALRWMWLRTDSTNPLIVYVYHGLASANPVLELHLDHPIVNGVSNIVTIKIRSAVLSGDKLSNLDEVETHYRCIKRVLDWAGCANAEHVTITNALRARWDESKQTLIAFEALCGALQLPIPQLIQELLG